MKVGTAYAGSLAEVALGEFGVVGVVDEAGPLDRVAVRVEWFEGRDRDLDVDDRLCGETRYCGRADVVDAESDGPEFLAQPGADLGEGGHHVSSYETITIPSLMPTSSNGWDQ